MKYSDSVEKQIYILSNQLKVYYLLSLAIIKRINFVVAYNFLIILGLLLFSVMCLIDIELAKRESFVITYHLLVLSDALAIYIKRKLKHKIRNNYIESLKIIGQLGDLIEWSRDRRKFSVNPPKVAIIEINTFYSIIQRLFFPYKKGVNYYNGLVVINIMVLLSVVLISFYTFFVDYLRI